MPVEGLVTNPVVVQLDLGQMLAALGTGAVTFIGAATAVGRMFFKYIESRDDVQRKADCLRDDQIVKLGGAVEQLALTVQRVADQKDEIVKAESASWREQAQKVNDGLIDLIKQVMTVTAQLRAEVEKMHGTQQQAAAELRQLTEAVRQNTEAVIKTTEKSTKRGA